MSQDLNAKETLVNLPLELRNDASLRLARKMTYVVAALVVGLVFWATISPVEEVAVASGSIVPGSAISDVHHLEGGIVRRVTVSEGDHVDQGQLLLELQPEQIASDLSQLEARVAGLRVKQMRLTASLDGQEPDFGAMGERYPELADQNMQAYRQDVAQAREAELQLELAAQRIREQLSTAEREQESLEAQRGLLKEQAEIREKSHARGYTSKHTLLQAQNNLEETNQRLVSARGRVAELSKTLQETETRLRETVAERRRRLTEERAEVAARLAEDEETLQKYRDRVERLNVVAPISGVVHSLVYEVGGEVVKPGAMVAQIVPEAPGVMAEVELKPSDIGHVRVGNPAEIRLSNYDPNVVGILRGEVKLISATTFENDDGQPFYRVRIGLEQDRLDVGGQKLLISPGTTLSAQIVTGSKTLLRYMLKPVYQSFDTAFAER